MVIDVKCMIILFTSADQFMVIDVKCIIILFTTADQM